MPLLQDFLNTHYHTQTFSIITALIREMHLQLDNLSRTEVLNGVSKSNSYLDS